MVATTSPSQWVSNRRRRLPFHLVLGESKRSSSCASPRASSRIRRTSAVSSSHARWSRVARLAISRRVFASATPPGFRWSARVNRANGRGFALRHRDARQRTRNECGAVLAVDQKRDDGATCDLEDFEECDDVARRACAEVCGQCKTARTRRGVARAL